MTTCDSVAEVLTAKFASLPYETVMGCVGTPAIGLASVAWPEARAAVPMDTPLSRKVTVPVGVPEPGATAATVAVKVTLWPFTDGFTEEETVDRVEALFTTWDKALEVMLVKFESPG